jgi:hypothetical protein
VPQTADPDVNRHVFFKSMIEFRFWKRDEEFGTGRKMNIDGIVNYQKQKLVVHQKWNIKIHDNFRIPQTLLPFPKVRNGYTHILLVGAGFSPYL